MNLSTRSYNQKLWPGKDRQFTYTSMRGRDMPPVKLEMQTIDGQDRTLRALKT